MPVIRIAALAVLVLAALIAIASAFPVLAGVPPLGLLVMMVIITANAAGVLWLTRSGLPARLGMAGLWLVLVGVAFTIVLAVSPLWMGLIVAPPPAGDFSAVLDVIARTNATFTTVMVLTLAALVAGWGLWLASRLLAKRRAA